MWEILQDIYSNMGLLVNWTRDLGFFFCFLTTLSDLPFLILFSSMILQSNAPFSEHSLLISESIKGI